MGSTDAGVDESLVGRKSAATSLLQGIASHGTF